MVLHRIRKGLDIPIAGAPRQDISDGPSIGRVAWVADGFPGLRPRVLVRAGQTVRRGDPLVEDASTPGIVHTAPGAGRVEAIHRGSRRALQSIVIELSETERVAQPVPSDFAAFKPGSGREGTPRGRDEIRDLLVASGAWTAFRTRPFSRVPDPRTVPRAILVTAIDTNPLAADPAVVVEERRAQFETGLRAIAGLSGGKTYLCVSPGSSVARVDAPVSVEEFEGPHPAGTAGVHIHLLEPVGRERVVWWVGYQDVISIGALLGTGRVDVSRVVSMAGPPVTDPRLVRTRAGASVRELTAQEGTAEGIRWIAGSVLSGKAAEGDVYGYLGRYDLQLTALREGGQRRFLAWLAPRATGFSAFSAFVPRSRRGAPSVATTDTYGSRRSIIPLGAYERVMPIDVLPTFLLRALAAGDIERAEELGCLELDEEDLALCSFVDPGKADFGSLLRHNLELIERAG